MQNSDLHVGGGLAQSFSAINDAKPTREPYLHPSHSPRTTDDSHNTQHISPHLLQLGWLQPKQPQTKHKSTSTPFVSHSLGLRFKNLQSSSKGKWCKKTKQNNGLSAFFDEQRLYKICSEGLLHIYPLFWRANGSGQILVQHLLLKTLKNNTEAGNLVSCQVFQRCLSCCRSLAYLLGEASCWFHLTCSVLSSALLGVDDHRANTDSLNHKCL